MKMNNVFPFKEECGKIQVSSDWEAEWYMLTKRLEIARLSIEGIQLEYSHQAGNVRWELWPQTCPFELLDTHMRNHTLAPHVACASRGSSELAGAWIHPDTHHKSTIPARESMQIMCATVCCNQSWCQPFQNLFPCLQRALSGSSLPDCST